MFGKSRFNNIISLKIIISSCAIKIISCEENKLNVLQNLFSKVL